MTERLWIWVARYGSRCGICDKSILEGDECCYVDDEPAHAECAREQGYETAHG